MVLEVFPVDIVLQISSDIGLCSVNI